VELGGWEKVHVLINPSNTSPVKECTVALDKMKLAKGTFEDLLHVFFDACDEKISPVPDKNKAVISSLLFGAQPLLIKTIKTELRFAALVNNHHRGSFNCPFLDPKTSCLFHQMSSWRMA